MGDRLAGKVVLVTGAARGQGASHCVRLAREGADIIAVDIQEEIESVAYGQGSAEDMAQVVAEVEALDRRITAFKADVRERGQLRAAVDAGVAELGRLDVVCANAGILPIKEPHSPMQFVDAMDVDFGGVVNTVAVSLPHLSAGASIVLTGSTAGLMPNTLTNPVLGPGGVGYGLAKRFIVTYTETLAVQLAPLSIRVNAIHPTNTNTRLLHNRELNRLFRPDVDEPTQEDTLPAQTHFNALPVPFIEPVDLSNAVLFLASDEGRYITGVNLRVDAGSMVKWPNGPM